MERVVLRHRVVCKTCGSRLPPRTEAWWDEANQLAQCPSCHQAQVAGAAPSSTADVAPEPGPEAADASSDPRPVHPVRQAPWDPWAPWEPQPPSSSEEKGTQGRAGRAGTHREEPRGEAVPADVDQPVQERSIARLFERPDPDRSPSSAGEPGPPGRVGPAAADPSDPITSVLEAASNRGLCTLHRRRIPGTQVAIDHLVVSPNGIWLVVDQPSPEGKVERRDVGDWFTPEPRLYVGGTDRTGIVVRARTIDTAIGKALAGALVEAVPRYRMVCFADAPPGWFDRPFPFDDVWITWSRHLVEPMLATTHLAPAARDEIFEFLEDAFPPI